jgi:hypothetical protein
MSQVTDQTMAGPRTRFRSSMMVLALTAATVVASSTSAAASGDGHSSAALRLQQRYWAWIAGSDTNPAFREGFCGEQVGSAFFLNAAFSPGNTVFDCTIPADMPIVFSPGGALEWEEPNLVTDAALLAQRDIDGADLTDPVASLDGRDLHPARSFARSGVYRIPIGPNSLIKAIDPTVPADATSIRVASLGWTLQTHELDKGSHTIFVSDTIGSVVLSATFHITVSDD